LLGRIVLLPPGRSFVVVRVICWLTLTRPCNVFFPLLPTASSVPISSVFLAFFLLVSSHPLLLLSFSVGHVLGPFSLKCFGHSSLALLPPLTLILVSVVRRVRRVGHNRPFFSSFLIPFDYCFLGNLVFLKETTKPDVPCMIRPPLCLFAPHPLCVGGPFFLAFHPCTYHLLHDPFFFFRAAPFVFCMACNPFT